MLVGVFENFPNNCLELYKLEFSHTKVKSDHLTDIDVFLMVEKVIKGGIFYAIHWHAKANNEHMKDYDKNKELSHLKYWDVNN